MANGAGQWLSRHAMLLVSLALVAAVAFLALRPGGAATDPTGDDVAKAWNDSIARLGIQPVYPPEEDLVVGDIWVSVAGAPQDIPLLGKGSRIAHIDVRKDIVASNRNQPIFGETVPVAKDGEFRHLDRKETTVAADGQIALSLAAFPGITISHTSKAKGLLRTGVGLLGAGRDDQQVEEIRIPVAETYGISSPVGFDYLDTWCNAEATKDYCTDEAARKIIEFVVGPAVLAKLKDGRYACQLQISLITRVFLTREIKQRRLIAGSGQVGVNAPTPEASADASATATAGTAPTLSADRSDRVESEIRQVFQRPVAFGFRAVNFALTPAAPAPTGK
jgi:hypothetical protein